MIKKSLVFLSVILLFSLTNYIAFYGISENLIETPYQEENLPQLNNQNINIITPENRTYSKPMGGYYPASDSFEHDPVGEKPSLWGLKKVG